jgi:anti-sigma regulatory factor (Ser/Thr protein kinase)
MREIDVYGDEEKIVQVFCNLIENAIKFVEKGYIKISVTEKKDMVECAVKDTGAGLSKGQIERAFDRFQQFGRVDGAGEKGTGIGLAITREIVEMHHGSMWVESKPGKGSSFIFTLPKHTSEQVFKEHVTTAVEEALFWDSKMSLIVVAVEDLDGGKKELLEKKIDSILTGIESVLRGSLRRKGDGAFRNSGDVMVILADCDRQQVINVKKRLELVLKNHLIRKRLDKRIAMNFSCVTFPDDERTVEELIRKAKKVK